MIQIIEHKLDPAKTVIEMFATSEDSGVNVMAALLGTSRTCIYNWMRPKEMRGTNGLIPSQYQSKIIKEARRRRLPLDAEFLIGFKQ